ncbi:MAG: hypothetical protein QF475_00835 [Candidatus Undinarchaeales archaeon]|jgi:membrane protein implicated in regulation of membrane protease activity|nr:hypothetical protein [Candidatus Undinarchaeales archaeon]|tara:strand:- start:503 stop:745 length:243 start_codon:yes stop_codon:yes gene_type:complete
MSARDKLFGGILCLLALLVGVVYFVVLINGPTTFWFFTLSPLLALEIVVSVFFVFAVIVMLWVGYTIMTTPSIEDIEKKK